AAALRAFRVADFVEDEERGLGTEVRRVADAGRFQVRLGLRGDRARILRVRLLLDRVDGVAGYRQRRGRQERIDARRVRIGDEDHVGRVDRLPTADRAAVEEVAVLERADFEL